MSKDAAETHATQEHSRFADLRREYKEQLGEVDSIRLLEDAGQIKRGEEEAVEDAE